jgi:hypothetical protein
MEARSEVRGSGISKSFVAVCAVVATMGLGVTAGVVAKNLSAPAASSAHIAQVQFGTLPFSGYRGGKRAVEEQLTPAYQQVDTRGVQAAPAAVGPDDRPTTTQLVPGMSLSTLQVDTRGIIPAEAFGTTAPVAHTSFLGPDAQDRNTLLADSMLASEEYGGTAQVGSPSFLGPDAQDRNSQLAQTMRVVKPHGYI